MDPAVLALGGVVVGVVLDQTAGIVRESHREKRAKAELQAARFDSALQELLSTVHSLDNKVAGHDAVLSHLVPESPLRREEGARGHR